MLALDNIDGPQGYYSKLNKSDRESQCMVALIHETNKINEQANKCKHIDTENRVVATRWKEA